VQFTLATSLAGQALLSWGIADMLQGGGVKHFCVTVALLSAVLFVLFPDHIHRVLMILFAACAVVGLVYAFEQNGLVPLLGPLFAGGLVAVHRGRAGLAARGAGPLVRPLMSGLMLSAFGCLLLSTVYVLPELGVDFTGGVPGRLVLRHRGDHAREVRGAGGHRPRDPGRALGSAEAVGGGAACLSFPSARGCWWPP
jgi:hypothetical protein